MPLNCKHRIFFFSRKNLTPTQNHIKCISINACTFNLITHLIRFRFCKVIRIISINLRKLALTSTLLVILEESELPVCGRHCVILNSPYFYLIIFSAIQFIGESTFQNRMFIMSGCFLIFSQALAPHSVVKIRLFVTDNGPST